MKEKQYLEILHRASHETGYTLTGDDAAVVPAINVLSTDQFVEGTHFEWSHMNARELGHKAMVQALSDLAAMGAEPRAVLCSLAWNSKHDVHIEEFINGLTGACVEYKVPLVGGDITASQSLFYSDITVCGFTAKPILKKGARVGDILAVTGTFGDACAGLELVQKEISRKKQTTIGFHNHADTSDVHRNFEPLVSRYRRPHAHISTILKLRQEVNVHAATDISDSLSKSLLSLADHSSVGFSIDSDRVPVSEALKNYVSQFQKDLESYKWSGGEDYQLLVALPAETPQHVLTDHGLTAIGRVSKTAVRHLKTGDKVIPLTEVGWDPFAL